MGKRRKAGSASWEEIVRGIRAKRPDRLSPSLSEEWLGHDARLDAFQGACNFELPPRYREFITRFGAGTLSAPWCQFFSCAVGVTTSWDMFVWNMQHWRLAAEGDGADERARRLVLFGMIWSNEFYGWDPQEVTRKHPREYAIYAVWRFRDGTTRLAGTFPEFIGRFCLGEGLYAYLKLDPENQKDSRTRSEFEPLHRPSPRWIASASSK